MSLLMDAGHRTLIDELLAEQGQMTAVERFARKHEHQGEPAQARYYRELIPRAKPGAGQQYAFGVDLDACTGCKACVSACHSLNGLDEEETWRSVGMIHGDAAEPYLQTITTACHHCVEPGCLEGCPVMAYDKDPQTGIVRHLDDQCIGCQYCILKCPYDVPKYSEKKGIVRKCDMCTGRLAQGEAPACVQACPTHAIRIELVDKAEVSRAAQPGTQLIPGAFDSNYTKPPTRYRTRRPMPEGARPSDAAALLLEHAHWPLIGMLLLTQMAGGLFVILAVLLALGSRTDFRTLQAPLSTAGFLILNAGLGVSVLHLGRPLGAWRFFLGLRTSWMSREILAFTIFAGAAAACAGASLWPAIVTRIPAAHALEHFLHPDRFVPALAVLTSVLGLAGIACSAMIYVDTRRTFWKSALTFPQFFGSTAILGTAGAACLFAWSDVFLPADLRMLAGSTSLLAALIRAALFGWLAMRFLTALRNPAAPNHRSALTLWRLCPALILAQPGLCAITVTFGLGAALVGGATAVVGSTIALIATAAAQVIERYFYFTAVVAPRMPGGIAS